MRGAEGAAQCEKELEPLLCPLQLFSVLSLRWQLEFVGVVRTYWTLQLGGLFGVFAVGLADTSRMKCCNITVRMCEVCTVHT